MKEEEKDGRNVKPGENLCRVTLSQQIHQFLWNLKVHC
jgi:hypothetical protein